MNKLKFARLLLNLVFFAGLLSKSYGQLIGSGISEDPVRYSSTPSAQEEAYSKHSTFKTASSSYTDTLRLPFFEDFTGHVISIDSIVGTTLDNLLRLYDPSLSTFVNGTPIFIGFQAPIPSTTIPWGIFH